MKNSIYSQLQYILLVVLSFFALIIWQNSIHQNNLTASTKILHESRQQRAVDNNRQSDSDFETQLKSLSGPKLKQFTDLHCAKLKPEIKTVIEYKDQECNCEYHSVGKLRDLRNPFLRERVRAQMLSEDEEVMGNKPTKEGCLLLPEIKLILKQKELEIHESKIKIMKLEDRVKKLDVEKEELFDESQGNARKLVELKAKVFAKKCQLDDDEEEEKVKSKSEEKKQEVEEQKVEEEKREDPGE